MRRADEVSTSNSASRNLIEPGLKTVKVEDAQRTDASRTIRYVARKRTCASCRCSGIGGYVRFLEEYVEQRCDDCLGAGRTISFEAVETVIAPRDVSPSQIPNEEGLKTVREEAGR